MIEVEPTDAVELPADELALLVVRDMVTSRTRNTHSYLNQLATDDEWRNCRGAVDAVSDAIGWLWSAGMLAPVAQDPSAHAVRVTKRGREAAAAASVNELRALTRLDASLHPALERKVRPLFLLGEYENAIFTAMKLVEIRVRKIGGYEREMIGAKLMTEAFKPGGPLVDPEATPGEVTGMMQLFTGAYAVLRNPSAHREVPFDDIALAADAVMTASLLMRLLDGVEKRRASSASGSAVPDPGGARRRRTPTT